MAGKVLAEDQLFESSEEKRKASLSSFFCNKISLLEFLYHPVAGLYPMTSALSS